MTDDTKREIIDALLTRVDAQDAVLKAAERVVACIATDGPA